MIVLIDNYDSFTFNIEQMIAGLGIPVHVVRNDAMTVEEIAALDPAGIVISPGPGRPEQAGVSVEAVQRLGSRLPILGVCLGHQAIGVAYGAAVGRAPAPCHGKVSDVRHSGAGVFAGLPDPVTATRYHSLAVDRATLPEALELTAWTDDGVIMGLRHRQHPVEGVQFHPESCLTPEGPRLVQNFLGRCVG